MNIQVVLEEKCPSTGATLKVLDTRIMTASDKESVAQGKYTARLVDRTTSASPFHGEAREEGVPVVALGATVHEALDALLAEVKKVGNGVDPANQAFVEAVVASRAG